MTAHRCLPYCACSIIYVIHAVLVVFLLVKGGETAFLHSSCHFGPKHAIQVLLIHPSNSNVNGMTSFLCAMLQG